MSDNDAFCRRLAIQIVSQLPDDPAAAAAVLRYANEVVDNFLGGRWYRTQSDQGLTVVPFREPSSTA